MVAAVSGVSAGATPQKPSEPALLPVPLHRCSPVKWQPTQHKSTYLTDRVRGVAVPLVSSGSAGAHIGTDARPQTDVYAQLTRLAMVAAGPGSYQALKQRGGPDEVVSRPGQNPYRTWHRGADAHITVLMCVLWLCGYANKHADSTYMPGYNTISASALVVWDVRTRHTRGTPCHNIHTYISPPATTTGTAPAPVSCHPRWQ